MNRDGEVTKNCYCHLETVSYQEFFEQGGSADIISLISGGEGRHLYECNSHFVGSLRGQLTPQLPPPSPEV